jgi:copper oxidase (laccase) domain-containing protein
MNQLALLNENSIAKIPRFLIEHGITTNKFGNCGFSVKENNNIEREQNLRLMRLVNASCFFKIVPEHKDRIKKVELTNKIINYLKCDALIYYCPLPKTQKPILISNTADCPVIFLADKDKHFIAIIHSGWRGTACNIVKQTIKKAESCFKINPKTIQVGIWGGICVSCYKVNYDLEKYFPNKIINGHLNLRKIITEQLLDIGILSENIFLIDNSCSAHSLLDSNDFLFASYRRDKNHKRNAAFITL